MALLVCATSSDQLSIAVCLEDRARGLMNAAVLTDKATEGLFVSRSHLRGCFEFSTTRYPADRSSRCKTLAIQNQKLAQARDLLLPRLMNGEIAV